MSRTSLWSRKNIGCRSFHRHFPDTYILRSLLGRSYFTNVKPIESRHKVLDVGCLYTNNLLPFSDRGCELYGIEVTAEAVEIARRFARKNRMSVDIRLGHNRHLPFSDGFFDFVLSINTIHYEETPETVLAGLREMRRVLKLGGCCFLATAGQEDAIVKTARRNGPNDYTVRYDDFRRGERFCFFESEADLKAMLAPLYTSTEIATVTERFPIETVQRLIAKCIK